MIFTEAERQSGTFETTDWGLVAAASCDRTTEAERALAVLCQNSWRPLYTYLRRVGQSPQDSEDLVQGFFARLLENEFVKDADPVKGRFRTFLLTALKHYAANEWKKARCQKRGGGQVIVSLDLEETESRFQAEAKDAMTPEKAYDRQWALSLLAQVLARLKEQYSARGEGELFIALEERISPEAGARPLAEIAREFGKEEGAIRTAVSRLRSRFRALLKEEVARTVSSKDQVEDEICDLFAALEGGPQTGR